MVEFRKLQAKNLYNFINTERFNKIT